MESISPEGEEQGEEKNDKPEIVVEEESNLSEGLAEGKDTVVKKDKDTDYDVKWNDDDINLTVINNIITIDDDDKKTYEIRNYKPFNNWVKSFYKGMTDLKTLDKEKVKKIFDDFIKYIEAVQKGINLRRVAGTWDKNVDFLVQEWNLDRADFEHENTEFKNKNKYLTFFKWLKTYHEILENKFSRRQWVDAIGMEMDYYKWKWYYRRGKDTYLSNLIKQDFSAFPHEQIDGADDEDNIKSTEQAAKWLAKQNAEIEEYKKNQFFFNNYIPEGEKAKQEAEKKKTEEKHQKMIDEITGKLTIQASEDEIEVDDDSLLENTNDNNEWKNNKNFIKEVIYNLNDNGKFINNYGNNLLLYYKNKIEEVEKLMKGKSNDLTKNFMGDITIQDEQFKSIGNTIKDAEIAKGIDSKTKDKITKGYYKQIGNKSEEVMGKDYDDRNKTIQYLLLIMYLNPSPMKKDNHLSHLSKLINHYFPPLFYKIHKLPQVSFF